MAEGKEELLRCTSTERDLLRQEFWDPQQGVALFYVGKNSDGTWYGSHRDVMFEGHSPVDVLNRLVDILLEA